jgi:ACS family sodium-dependent inorganic phosphate cotransporter-like MFS transporter 5
LLLYRKSYRFDFLHLSFLPATVIPALGLVAVGWFGCDRLAVLLLLVITGGFSGAGYAGNQMNHITLSPHYAGTLFGITNAASSVCGFLAPYTVGLLIKGNVSINTPHQEQDMLRLSMCHF